MVNSGTKVILNMYALVIYVNNLYKPSRSCQSQGFNRSSASTPTNVVNVYLKSRLNTD